MSAGIYLIRNTVNGRVYVGSSVNCTRRFGEHRTRLTRGVHVNAMLQAAWAKHGAKAFEFEILASVPRAEDLAIVEQQVMQQFDVIATGYNLSPTAGSTTGWRAGPETKARMSAAAKRRDNSAQVEAMRRASTGRKRPQHVIDAMQAGRRANPIDEGTRARMATAAVARSRYSQEDRATMARLRDAGQTLAQVAEAFGCSGSNVHVYVKQWRAAQ